MWAADLAAACSFIHCKAPITAEVQTGEQTATGPNARSVSAGGAVALTGSRRTSGPFYYRFGWVVGRLLGGVVGRLLGGVVGRLLGGMVGRLAECTCSPIMIRSPVRNKRSTAGRPE